LKVLSIHSKGDKELIAAMQLGESWALKKLFTDNYDGFMIWAKRTFQLGIDEVQDIYQDSVIITYENIQKGKLNNLSSSISTYLFAVGKNLVREHIRREVKFSNEEESIIRELYSHPYDTPTLPEPLLDATKRELEKMEEPCKSILTLFYYFDKSIEEIATTLNYKDKTTVKTQKSRCLKYLRENISYKW
jgi:RNA polymerase sigma factor (sigma-70 family)